jgi:hypothetical protein
VNIKYALLDNFCTYTLFLTHKITLKYRKHWQMLMESGQGKNLFKLMVSSKNFIYTGQLKSYTYSTTTTTTMSSDCSRKNCSCLSGDGWLDQFQCVAFNSMKYQIDMTIQSNLEKMRWQKRWIVLSNSFLSSKVHFLEKMRQKLAG